MKFHIGLVALVLASACGVPLEAQDVQDPILDIPQDKFVAPGPVALSFCASGEGHLFETATSISGAGPVARVLGTDGGALVLDTMHAGIQWWEPGMKEVSQVWADPAPYSGIVGLFRGGEGVIEVGTTNQNTVSELEAGSFEVLGQTELPDNVWGISSLAVSPNGRWAIPGQSWVYEEPLHLMDLESGEVLSTMVRTDGVNKALFYDDSRFIVGGTVNLAGLELQIRNVDTPEIVEAAWTLEDRRCGSLATLHDIHLGEAGDVLLVSGEIYGSKFMAVLDADTLEERSIVFDLSWAVSAPTALTSDIIVTTGDAIRFWDKDLNLIQEKPLVEFVSGAVVWDDTLVTVGSEGVLRQFECKTVHDAP